MAVGFGYTHWIGTGEESTFGTGVSASKFIEVNSDTLKKSQTMLAKPALRGVSHDRRVISKSNVEGSLEFQLGWEGYGRFFKHALGTLNTSGSGPYTHAFTCAQALPTGLSIVSNRDAAGIGGTSCFRYLGCQINKLTLKQSADEFLMMTVDFLGRDREFIAAPSPSFPTFDGIAWDELVVDVDGSPIDVEEIELTIENNLAADRYKLGSTLRKGFGRGDKRKISGKIVKEFESITELQLFTNLTNVNLNFEWTSGTDVLTIDLPVCEFDGGDPEVSSSGPIKLELPFTAYMSSSEGDEITVDLVNSASTE